jgi:hypothetical protein
MQDTARGDRLQWLKRRNVISFVLRKIKPVALVRGLHGSDAELWHLELQSQLLEGRHDGRTECPPRRAGAVGDGDTEHQHRQKERVPPLQQLCAQ